MGRREGIWIANDGSSRHSVRRTTKLVQFVHYIVYKQNGMALITLIGPDVHAKVIVSWNHSHSLARRLCGRVALTQSHDFFMHCHGSES